MVVTWWTVAFLRSDTEYVHETQSKVSIRHEFPECQAMDTGLYGVNVLYLFIVIYLLAQYITIIKTIHHLYQVCCSIYSAVCSKQPYILFVKVYTLYPHKIQAVLCLEQVIVLI